MRTVVFAALVAVLVAAPTAVWASHTFTDVPNSHTFHDDIAWMKENNITFGCNPPANTQYCPDESVTRGQMGAFMRRLAENQVVDAASVQGLDAFSLSQAVYTTRLAGPLDIPGVGDMETVLDLNLRGGEWLVLAKTWYWNTGTTDGWADCRLLGPNGEDNTWVDVATDDDSDQAAASFILVDGFDANSTVELQCRDGGHTVQVRDAVITALRLTDFFEQ